MLKNKLRLIRLRKAATEGRDITIKEMAEFYGASPRLYAEWESNNGRQPGTEWVWRILKTLSTEKITDLFEETSG